MTAQQEPEYRITESELIQYALLYAEAHSADIDSIGKVHMRAKAFEEEIRSRNSSFVKSSRVCGVFMKRCGNCARNTGHTYCHQMLKVRRMPADGRGADPGLHAGTGGERT